MKKKEKIRYKIPTVTKRQQKKRLVKDILVTLIPCVVLVLLMRVFFLIGSVPSRSMYPLMDTNYGMIANRMAYKFSAPSRGDVIVFKKGNSYLTKRIIGTPGDTVAIQNGIVYINEQPVIESYLAEENSTEPLNDANYFEVPQDSYFVLGDNRKDSNDSRAWKDPYVPILNIKAKVLCSFCLNPFSHGILYNDVEAVSIMETNSGAPTFDKTKIVEQTEENNGNGKDAISSTLPVVTIAPERIEETMPETEDTGEETLVSEGVDGEITDSTNAEESNEGLVDDGNIPVG